MHLSYSLRLPSLLNFRCHVGENCFHTSKMEKLFNVECLLWTHRFQEVFQELVAATYCRIHAYRLDES
jgi:hypothetical protein